MFWEKYFTGELKLFQAVNMKICGRSNVRKHRDIKGSYKYVTLYIWLKFDSLDKMKIKSSESKDNMLRTVKGLITSLSFKDKVRPNNYKKSRYYIGNVRKKYLSNIIRDFEKLPYESYEKKSHKHKRTDS